MVEYQNNIFVNTGSPKKHKNQNSIFVHIVLTNNTLKKKILYHFFVFIKKLVILAIDIVIIRVYIFLM